MAHPGGRPTTYKPEYVIKAKEYLDKSKDDWEIYISQQVENTKEINGSEFSESKTIRIGKMKVRLPSVEGLAKYLGISRSSIYDWAKVQKEFSDILDEILEEQAERLINMGLSGDYNPTIAKLLLGKHGYIEKSEGDFKGDFNITGILSELQGLNK